MQPTKPRIIQVYYVKLIEIYYEILNLSIIDILTSDILYQFSIF